MQRLFYKERKLGYKCQLSMCGAVDHTKFRLEKSIQVIIINPLTNQSLPIFIFPSDKVYDLCVKIFTLIGMEPDSQRLLFHNQELQLEKLLSQYKIKDNDTISLIGRLKGGACIREDI
eukprot:GHVL01002308.1.p1 GENE.GHVL01002308.1~~GHVL01002308.1.p1  ORF type:complete len:118 (-),score=3.70 GHVL01002308.1:616-969(-)